MSYHVLHILSYGSYLRKDKGNLLYQNHNEKKTIPIEDLKAVVIAAKGVSLSDSLISTKRWLSNASVFGLYEVLP